MTADACREWRGELAAAALGHLGADETLALRSHLDGCAACRGELEELTAVARALPFADLAQVAGDSQGPPAELARLVADRVAQERARATQRRRRRFIACAAAAAAAVVLIGVGAVALSGGGETTAETTVTFRATAEVTGVARLTARDAGTEIGLEADGLEGGEWYWLWLTGADGDRVGAGTFRGTESAVDVTLTAALDLEETRRIWVTDGDDQIVLDAML